MMRVEAGRVKRLKSVKADETVKRVESLKTDEIVNLSR